MGIRPFTKSNPNDKAAANLESAMVACWESIVKNPLLQNLNIVKNVSISTSDTTVSHGLGKAITGWVVVRKNANIVVYESSTTNSAPTASIILKASGSGTISVLFF